MQDGCNVFAEAFGQGNQTRRYFAEQRTLIMLGDCVSSLVEPINLCEKKY